MLTITATGAQPSAETDQPNPDGLPDLSTTPTDPAEAADTEHTVAKPALPGGYELLPIKQIKPNPDNVRDDAQSLPGIVENLQEDGVRGLLAPVIVTPLGDDTYLIIDGEQRYWSAVEAEQEYIPAIVRDDLAGNRDQIISMLRQVHRKDPTAAQVSRGIQQLALDGMSDEEIARRTGYHPEQVKAGRCVAALGKHTAERTHALGLDFTQAAALAEFTDEPDTIETLLQEAEDAGPFAFARAVEQARSARNAREAEAARRAELTAAGVALLAEHPGYHDAKVKEISDLRDAEGQRMTAEDHIACPGHAVLLYLDFGHRLTERTYCTDWRKHGHTQYSYSTTTTRSGPMTEEEKAERRRVIENNKLMEAANTVRREWLTNLLAAKTPPKGTNKLIAEMLADSGYILSTWINGGRKMLDDLLSPGKTKRAGTSRVPARVSDARYTVISLAAIAAANESAITRTSWRAPDPAVAKWLQWCITNGLQIGKVEQLIIDGVANRTTNRRTAVAVATNTEPDDPQPARTEDEPEQAETEGHGVNATTVAAADTADADTETDSDTTHNLAA
ncbi:ParB/RepB/Spo0J family partition protein [Micromonospora aurantiaca]|uniref:ParB/RepB/Spo0J family partition protein n=1 Tax=Micromonospora aurantiaca (nom. illeg.) TaxID=47850 RepID=UPI00119F5C76|nr:ParB N-terminal domain-containing protein [Micromonospora aurantiaca]UFN92668.1 ParB N-terminal domain-containing protein [Micromonospora aurantiaca]